MRRSSLHLCKTPLALARGRSVEVVDTGGSAGKVQQLVTRFEPDILWLNTPQHSTTELAHIDNAQ